MVQQIETREELEKSIQSWAKYDANLTERIRLRDERLAKLPVRIDNQISKCADVIIICQNCQRESFCACSLNHPNSYCSGCGKMTFQKASFRIVRN